MGNVGVRCLLELPENRREERGKAKAEDGRGEQTPTDGVVVANGSDLTYRSFLSARPQCHGQRDPSTIQCRTALA